MKVIGVNSQALGVDAVIGIGCVEHSIEPSLACQSQELLPRHGIASPPHAGNQHPHDR
jgi:hypothetical protein